jgi:oligoribonuclease NrnB/cAMP/cGMP phosphodiesterase (DHH superfamily)
MTIIIQPFDIIVFHYPCQDGLASGYVATLAHELNGWPKPELYPIAHGVSLDQTRFINRRVLFCDYSPSLEILNQIELVANAIVVLDHHVTARDALTSKPYAIFDMGRSGVGITWDYFFPSKPIPLFLSMVQDRDLWVWSIFGSKDFCLGFLTVCSTINQYDFPKLFKIFDELYTNPDKINYYIGIGGLLQSSTMCKVQGIAEQALKKITEYQGKRVCVVNCTADYISELGNVISSNANVDFAVLWRHDNVTGEYYISLRSCNKANVSDIAKSFGGGGHPNAAGFSSSISPLEIFI